MATILCVSGDVPAMLYASVELSRRLAAAGHRLKLATAAEAERLAAANGLELLPLQASEYEAFLAGDSARPTIERVRRLGARRQAALESLGLESLKRVLARVEPDLVLIDGEMHEHVIVIAASGVPMALLNCFVSIWRRPGLPPPHCLARPGVGWRGSRLGAWLQWRALWLRKQRRAWSNRVGRVGCDRLSLLRQLAREAGFDLSRETDDSQWLIPFTYRRLPVLSLHAEEFELPHRAPRRVRYVGPMPLHDRGDEPMSPAATAELEAVFERRRSGRTRLIYAAFGSYFSTDPELVRRLVEAVAGRSDWELVLSLGGRKRPAELDALPERVHAFEWPPQLRVLRHADVAVTHGGINTIDECVHFGVPMLVYCGFETDMAGTTSRVVHHGIGIAGDARRDDPRAIERRIERLLEEASFRRSVEQLRADYLAYVENRVAERAVESLLEAARQRRDA